MRQCSWASKGAAGTGLLQEDSSSTVRKDGQPPSGQATGQAFVSLQLLSW